ncbi:solute carrier organic anion transporter family member 1C1 isoform X1 [Phyllopteryx taeniolatus]|uniref:solute carrier organic anion transporter family member 1C1 isoform X1 n=1 Tax=Phyllopteryx taeniolatus TaxID=161469 RepID=UPI002AD3E953|nr:solute carrier organic anion transporter family member 1C1 isoform X1 [Phyllopteryx taeniolatus]XP_061637417.1 solute carrier organic anion transporter family member 1C1 isoform X1 [Phyllopteryx taeniolatus]
MEVGAERGDMQKNRRSDDASRKTHASSCSSLKMFLVALSFAYFAKALSGSYMKSTITQLERRFDIPSYLIGIIDGSFEIGNLLVIAFVSYFGAKLHRPKIIAVGCVLMSIGTFIIALPHFIIGRYEYDSPPRWVVNSSLTPSPCSVGSTSDLSQDSKLLEVPTTDCEGDSNLSMWIYVLLGNVLRGIGETPVQPLGISYIDDFASEENAALYVGCVQTISVVGPVFGYLLGSLCAKIYVDIGFVKLETITITPADSRWVGAWWLGYLIAGVITLLSAIPFWFLPRSLPIPGSHTPEKPEQTSFIKDSDPMKHKYPVEEHTSFIEMAKDFIPTLRSLLGHPVYLIYLCVTIIQLNSLIGMVTYKPKYIEQHFRQSASKANFLMGVINIPAVALGMFSGGLLMKKMKLNITGAAKFAFVTSFIGYILSLFLFVMSCENAKIAGVTLPYNSMEGVSHDKHSVFTTCNSNCFCSANNWDPVCGGNGITYVSPCLAGCTSSTGSGKNTVFSNCSCVGPAANLTANIGQCSDKDDCDRMFPYFLALSVITSFIISLGGTPGYMLLIRCIKPQLKSFALGFHALATHTLAGIPAPIYFGAIIDTTCLKWGQKRCGGRGACRIYNTTAYRIAYLGLTLGLRTISFLICIPGFILLSRQLKEEHDTLRGSLANGGTELEVLRKEEFVISNSKTLQRTSENGTDRETRL